MTSINHFHQPDFDIQAQSDHILHTVETPQNSRGGLENTFSLMSIYLGVLERVVIYFNHTGVDFKCI